METRIRTQCGVGISGNRARRLDSGTAALPHYSSTNSDTAKLPKNRPPVKASAWGATTVAHARLTGETFRKKNPCPRTGSGIGDRETRSHLGHVHDRHPSHRCPVHDTAAPPSSTMAGSRTNGVAHGTPDVPGRWRRAGLTVPCPAVAALRQVGWRPSRHGISRSGSDPEFRGPRAADAGTRGAGTRYEIHAISDHAPTALEDRIPDHATTSAHHRKRQSTFDVVHILTKATSSTDRERP